MSDEPQSPASLQGVVSSRKFRVSFNQGINEDLCCIVICDDKYKAEEFVKEEYELSLTDRDSVRATEMLEEIYYC